VALKHENLSLEDSLVREWEVNSHLVAVEVGIERSTSQWVELDSLTLDELRLECLDAETVKCRSTVEEHWVTLHDVLENIPDNWFATVNDTLSRLNSLHYATLDELADNEWLVEFGCHKLRKTALAHVKFRTNDDNGTC
jgi:hypothetical protein